MRLSEIFPLSFTLSLTCTADNLNFNWTGSFFSGKYLKKLGHKEQKNDGFYLDYKIAQMNEQIMLEMKKLRQLTMESMIRTERGYLLTFAIVAIITKVIIIVGIIFALQGININFKIIRIDKFKKN